MSDETQILAEQDQVKSLILVAVQQGGRYAFSIPSGAHRGLSGGRSGRRAGNSMEFMDHRDYVAGDDLRRVDWNAYARFDRLTVKLYSEEVVPRIDLIIDGSRSMDLPGTLKAGATLAIAAMLAEAAANAGYLRRTWMTGEGVREVEGGTGSALKWQPYPFDRTENPTRSFEYNPPHLSTGGVVVLISDLLWLEDPAKLLASLTRNAAMVIVIQVLAKADAEPPEKGILKLIDHESGEFQDMHLTERARREYLDALAKHQENWSRACRETNTLMTTVIAEDFVNNWQLRELLHREILRAK